MYLDRLQVKLLPSGGIVWTPNPDIEFNILFPNPKIRKRLDELRQRGMVDVRLRRLRRRIVDHQAGEYPRHFRSGVAGQNDAFDYDDIRVAVGLEFLTPRNFNGWFEVGGAFSRQTPLPQRLARQLLPQQHLLPPRRIGLLKTKSFRAIAFVQFAICNLQLPICNTCFLSFFAFPVLSFAQVVRLPVRFARRSSRIIFAIRSGSILLRPKFVRPKSSPAPAFPGKLVSHPDSSAQILAPPGETISPGPAEPPQSDIRSGFFQRAIFNGTWLPRTAGSGGFGQYDLETKLVVALPCPTTDSPLVITPGFAVHYLDGPADVDLPPRLFDCYAQFRWLSQVTPQLGLGFRRHAGLVQRFSARLGQGVSDARPRSGGVDAQSDHETRAWSGVSRPTRT